MLIVLAVVLSFLLPIYVLEEEKPKRRKTRRKSDPIAAAIRRLES